MKYLAMAQNNSNNSNSQQIRNITKGKCCCFDYKALLSFSTLKKDYKGQS